MQTEHPIEPAANTVGDSVELGQVSICMEWNSSVTNLPKVAERIPDRADRKHCQKQYGLWQVSTFVDCSSEVTPLPKDAERILDRANRKPCQRQRRAMEVSIFVDC